MNDLRPSSHRSELVFINQIFVHGIELALQVVNFSLLGIELLSLRKNASVLILDLFEFLLCLIIHELELVLILLVNLFLDGHHIVVFHGLKLCNRRLLVRSHSRRHLYVSWSEWLIHELVVGLLYFGVDHLQWL